MNEGVVITTDLLLLLSVTIIQILCFLHNLTCIILNKGKSVLVKPVSQKA